MNQNHILYLYIINVNRFSHMNEGFCSQMCKNRWYTFSVNCGLYVILEILVVS